MRTVIGDFLPVALGVAISPVPIIAVILMLLAPDATASSVAFLIGWVVGITVVVGLVVLLHRTGRRLAAVATRPPGPSWLKLALGAAAVLLAVKEWRSRPRPGDTPELPKWMSAIDSITPVKAFGLGGLLSAVNPKNLVLCLTGAVMIGSAGLVRRGHGDRRRGLRGDRVVDGGRARGRLPGGPAPADQAAGRAEGVADVQQRSRHVGATARDRRCHRRQGPGGARGEGVMKPVTKVLIRVDGEISDELSSAFPHLTTRRHPAQSTLTGDLADQEELQGVLNLLRSLGIDIVEIVTIPD